MQNTSYEPAGTDVVVAVMGATGTGTFTLTTTRSRGKLKPRTICVAGKSSFIHHLTEDDRIRIGHDQQSETTEIQTARYVDRKTGKTVMLIDTPGFDDSRDGVTDTDILQQIVDFLEPVNRPGQMLNGILYLHRISDPRVGGVAKKNIRMFRRLCGTEQLSSVRVVTTNWDRLHGNEGEHREADLKKVAFQTLLECGAQMRRHDNTVESAQRITSELIPLPPVTMQIQEELHDGKKLLETEAGKVLNAEMHDLQKKYEQEMAKMKKEFALALKAKDEEWKAELEEERKATRKKIARVEADRKKLEMKLEELQEDQERRMC